MNKEDMYQREQNKKAAMAAQQEAYKRYRLCDRMIAQLHWKATHMDNKKAKKDKIVMYNFLNQNQYSNMHHFLFV